MVVKKTIECYRLMRYFHDKKYTAYYCFRATLPFSTNNSILKYCPKWALISHLSACSEDDAAIADLIAAAQHETQDRMLDLGFLVILVQCQQTNITMRQTHKIKRFAKGAFTNHISDS